MVKEVIEDADYAATHDGKKYPSPPAPVANIPLYRGRGVPASEEKTTPGVSVHNGKKLHGRTLFSFKNHIIST